MPMRDPDNDVLFSSLAVSKSLLGLFRDNLQTRRVLTEKHHLVNIRPSVLRGTLLMKSKKDLSLQQE